MITQLWNPEDALLLDIPHNKNSIFFMYQDDGKKVFFSVTQLGDTLVCNIAANRKGKRILRRATNQMAQYLFFSYPEVKQLASHAFMNSQKNMTIKCGFEFVMAVQSEDADDGEFHVSILSRGHYG